jgi:hypothetical protein
LKTPGGGEKTDVDEAMGEPFEAAGNVSTCRAKPAAPLMMCFAGYLLQAAAARYHEKSAR